mmetsp:Transcript_78527/g.127415  ORF Transcript_78527/g.127415 Transcript_78527/m.127415 type:complete len:161 (-) Transcript_78527:612-1094(-)
MERLEKYLSSIVFVGLLSNFSTDAHIMNELWQEDVATRIENFTGTIKSVNTNKAHPTMKHFEILSKKARCTLEQWLSNNYKILDTLKRNGKIKESFPRKCIENEEYQRNRICRQGHPEIALPTLQNNQITRKYTVDTLNTCDCNLVVKHLLEGTLYNEIS